MMRIRVFHGLVCAALLLAVTGALHAQEFRATVKGQVVDSSKASLPGATVTVRNQDTNEVATATTNNEGNYTIPFLRPGVYTLTVEMSGFQKYTRIDMRLEVSQVAVINAATRERLFGGQPAVGRTLDVDGQSFRVVGVVADVPIYRIVPFSDVWVPTSTSKSRSYTVNVCVYIMF